MTVVDDRPSTQRGGPPASVGAVLSGAVVAGEDGRPLPLLKAQPARRRKHFERKFAEGQAARAAGVVEAPIDEVPESVERLRMQHQIRLDALDKILVENREAARVGLSSLARDQHPAALAKWIEDPDALNLILAGGTGSGKSQAAAAVAVHVCEHGAAGRNRRGEVVVRQLLTRSWTAIGYVTALRPNGAAEPVWQIRDRARTAELLVIDDLGAAMYDTASQHVAQELLELLSYRLERHLRTIFTTNLPSAAIKARYEDAFFSRLQESATLLQYLGPDRRQIRPLEW